MKMAKDIELSEITQLLKDLIYINSVISTELIKITENISAIRNQAPPPKTCIEEHSIIEKKIVEICEKYHPDAISTLKQHVLKHK